MQPRSWPHCGPGHFCASFCGDDQRQRKSGRAGDGFQNVPGAVRGDSCAPLPLRRCRSAFFPAGPVQRNSDHFRNGSNPRGSRPNGRTQARSSEGAACGGAGARTTQRITSASDSCCANPRGAACSSCSCLGSFASHPCAANCHNPRAQRATNRTQTNPGHKSSGDRKSRRVGVAARAIRAAVAARSRNCRA